MVIRLKNLKSNINKMEYPKMPEQADRRYKIVPSRRKEIIMKKKQGWSIKNLSVAYGVSITTIRHIINPEEKEKALKRTRERNRLERENGGEEYFKKERERNSERRKYARETNPELNDYYNWLINIKHQYWKKYNKIRWIKIKNNPDLLKKYNNSMKKWADKNREHVRKKSMENYYKRKLLNK